MKEDQLLEKGYIHQDSCPNGVIDDDETDSSVSDDDAEDDVREPRNGFQCCADRRCTTWFDLRSWFGYLATDLPRPDFQACFTDVAHGGIGLFEKLVVLGGKTLETFAEIHFFEQWASSARPYIPRELAEIVGQDAPRLLWAQKRVERTTAAQALFAFGKSYLSTAQDLPTRQAVAKYVKSCAGFACQSTDTENLYKWMPILVEHIFWIQRVRTEADSSANNLLQDLQEYLGYRHDQLLPRIRECLRNRNVPQRSDTPTGKELIRIYAADYFGVLAQESGVEKKAQAVWIDEELDMFMEGPAISLFSVLVMSLQPYLMTNDSQDLPTADVFVSTFYSLVAACWVLSTEDRVKIWMPALIQRLRQVQLLAQLSSFEGNVYTRTMRRRRLASQPVELAQVAGANNGARDVFRLWNVDPNRRLPAGQRIDESDSPRLLRLGRPGLPDSPSGENPPWQFGWFGAKREAGRERDAGEKSRGFVEQTLPSDRNLVLSGIAAPSSGGKAAQTLVLRPFARVVPPRRRPSPRQQPQAPGPPASSCLLSCGPPSSCRSEATAQHSFAWSSPCGPSEPPSEFRSFLGGSSQLPRQESVGVSAHLDAGSVYADQTRKPTTVKICLDDASASGRLAVVPAFASVSSSAVSGLRDLRVVGGQETRGGDRVPEGREPDARAILVGKNIQPVCLNFSKDESSARVYVTEVGDEEKAKLGVAGDATKAESQSELNRALEPLLQCQQMQLELQRLQLEQIQLQQETLLQARQAQPPSQSATTAASRLDEKSPSQLPISVRVELPPEAIKRALREASGTSGRRPDSASPQPGPVQASTVPFRGGDRSRAPAVPAASGEAFGPQKVLPKPVSIFAYAMQRPAPTPVRYDGTNLAFLPKHAGLVASRPTCQAPRGVSMQVPNLLSKQADERGDACAWTACLTEPEGNATGPWTCWPEQLRATCDGGIREGRALYCTEPPTMEACQRAGGQADDPPSRGFIPLPPSIQARARDRPVFGRQRTHKF
ncbi:apicomplexan specific, related protein [Toxoplasma gondii VEG]|uniref:Apicomplexan specific, related protein n=5 Tax=Toxoplasma gondii TaxID=5811 RepID=B9Q722_TOXGV|nr:apicomplexan specific, related protein [Toxoplasma gondii VEG]CEL76719.1 TPA: hypothetical protein BN1205_064240 [Toxoplasma gondii VEG]